MLKVPRGLGLSVATAAVVAGDSKNFQVQISPDSRRRLLIRDTLKYLFYR